MNMNEYLKYLQPMQDCAFATSYENVPYVRAMALLIVDEKFYMTSWASSAKIKHLRANDRFAMTLTVKHEDQLVHFEGNGKAEIINDAATKTKVFNAIEMIKCYWPSPEDPEFTLIELHFDAFKRCD